MISIICPVFNEASLVRESYDEIKKEITRLTDDYEIIFADDGSADNSKELMEGIAAEDDRFRSISWSRNKGMGFAHRRLYNEAKGDIVIQMDIDLSIKPAIFRRMIKEIKTNDVVIASRYKGIKAMVPFKRKLISRAYFILVRALFGIKVRDICSGFVAFRKNVLEDLELRSNKFQIHVELLYKLCRSGRKIKEIPTEFIHKDDHSKFRVMRDSLDTFILTLLLWKRLRLQ